MSNPVVAFLVVFVGGLVMRLPPDFESRTLLVQLTLGAVLLSLLVQGTTTGKLPRCLKLTQS